MWGGDCDNDDQCQGNLLCGVDNCKRMFPDADPQADCCYNPCLGGDGDVGLIFM